jgi:hypothetical protein
VAGVDLMNLFRPEFTDKRFFYKCVNIVFLASLLSAYKSNHLIRHSQVSIGIQIF